jgi:hypothetical protein
MYITCNKSTAKLNLIVLHGTSTVCGELLNKFTIEEEASGLQQRLTVSVLSVT